jgi:hypothetical protein
MIPAYRLGGARTQIRPDPDELDAWLRKPKGPAA